MTVPHRSKKIHIIGAGLAGLSAAVHLTKAGYAVTLSEAAAQAGGRCRSYYDAAIDAVIDNGNHLVLSGNRAVQDFLKLTGASDHLVGPHHAEFSFVDLNDDTRWRLRPNDGALPVWLLSASRRVPGTKLGDYLAWRHLVNPPKGATIGDIAPCDGPLWTRLMNPLLTSVLNTDPRISSAALAGAVLKETLLRGGKSYAPRIAQPTLAATFVEPALRYLADHSVDVRLGRRLRHIESDTGAATALHFADGVDTVATGDTVVLATPAWVSGELVPDLSVPTDFRAIVNAHFRMAPPKGAPTMTGVIGGTAEWIFCFEDRISVTISAAEAILDLPREDLARRIWSDITRALGFEAALPAWQIVKEKRATFAATPAEDAKRPGVTTHLTNLLLAGDWTATGLPATIEGALRSGETAAAAVQHG